MACDDLASFMMHGTGLPFDVKGALALYQQSCDAGSAKSCREVGYASEAGPSMRRPRVPLRRSARMWTRAIVHA